MDRSTKVVVISTAAAGVGVLAWWALVKRPADAAADTALQRAALKYQQEKGGSRKDALAQVGALACQGAGAYYGIPPNLSKGVCKIGGALFANTTRETVKQVSRGLQTSATGVFSSSKQVVNTVSSIPKQAARTVKKIFSDIF